MDGQHRTKFFYTSIHWRLFANDLLQAFVKGGFDVIEQPYIDHTLSGFRATYFRRYLFQQPTPFREDALDTVVQVVGLPFGRLGQKMVVLSAPRNTRNEIISDSIKLRLQVDETGSIQITHGDQINGHAPKPAKPHWTHGNFFNGYQCDEKSEPNKSNQQQCTSVSLPETSNDLIDSDLASELAIYVAHIIEAISPGLIELPTDMKLEILKRLNINSIIKMSQVNSEFRSLIFQHGEPLWRHLCHRDFNIKFLNRMVHRTWMELYREAYILAQMDICRKERALPGLPERPALPPAPHLLQIEWLPEVLQLPLLPIPEVAQPHDDLHLALEIMPLRRADSMDSIHYEL